MYEVKTTPNKKILLVLLAVLVLVGLGFGGWYLYGQRQQSLSDEHIDIDAQRQIQEEDESITQQEYASDNPALAFTYPSDWTVSEDEDEGTILVESPTFTYLTVDGASIEGNFRIYMRQGAREDDRRYIGRGIAVLPSETLKYENPSENQRKETSISFFGLDSGDNFAYFFIAGNFVLDAGQSLGSDYGSDEDTYIIGGGYSSAQLTDDLATHPVPPESYDDSAAFRQAIEIIKSIRIGRF